MKITVRVGTNNKVKIKGVYTPTDTVITASKIDNNTSVNRLDHLVDVEEGLTPTSGSTLVYNSINDKYQVEKLNISDLDGDLDGGSF